MRVLFVVLTVVVLLCVCVGWSIWESSHPKMALKITKQNGKTLLTPHCRGVNSLITIAFWSDAAQELLWQCDVAPALPDEIVYGVVQEKWDQKFPRDSVARPLSSGEVVYVYICFQYDDWTGASSRRQFFQFTVPDGARVERAYSCAEPRSFAFAAEEE